MNLGDRVDARYRLDEILGEGGMGVVYRAFDERLEREVALKVLGASAGPESHRRFLREARRTAQLRHPGLVEVFDVGEMATGEPYFVMEVLTGNAPKGPLDLDAFRALALAVCEAVGFAHAAGVVHRDLKPGNVMITEGGRIKVLDFGIYKDNAASMRLTEEGTFVGTVGYAAPEQIRGEEADARADVYSLGVMFYELLAGTPPFDEAASLATVVHQTLSVAPRPLDERKSGIPKAITQAIMRALSKNAGARFATAAAFGEALGAAPTAPPPKHVVLEEAPDQNDVELEIEMAPRAPAPVVTVTPIAPFGSPSWAMMQASPPPPAFLVPFGVLPVAIAKRVSVYSFFAGFLMYVLFRASMLTVFGFVALGLLAGVNWWVRARLDASEARTS